MVSELLGHVDGISSLPTKIDTPSTSVSWFTIDYRAITLICQSCEVDICIEIGHFSTVLAMWDHLHHMFDQSSSIKQYVIL